MWINLYRKVNLENKINMSRRKIITNKLKRLIQSNATIYLRVHDLWAALIAVREDTGNRTQTKLTLNWTYSVRVSPNKF
jgi:hypothetical protein